MPHTSHSSTFRFSRSLVLGLGALLGSISPTGAQELLIPDDPRTFRPNVIGPIAKVVSAIQGDQESRLVVSENGVFRIKPSGWADLTQTMAFRTVDRGKFRQREKERIGF